MQTPLGDPLYLLKHCPFPGCDGVTSPAQAVKEKEKDPDPDPVGEQLAKTEDPLGEATKLVQRLREHSGDRLRTHELAFEVCHPLVVTSHLLVCEDISPSLFGPEYLSLVIHFYAVASVHPPLCPEHV